MLQQKYNTIDFKISSRLFDDYDIYLAEYIGEEKNPACSAGKALSTLKTVSVIFHESSHRHYIACPKGKTSLSEIKNAMKPEKFEITQITTSHKHETGLINIITLLTSSRLSDDRCAIINSHFNYILPKYDDKSLVAMTLRFKKVQSPETGFIYNLLDFHTATFRTLDNFGPNDNIRKYGPFYLLGGKTLKEIPFIDGIPEKEIYVKKNRIYKNQTISPCGYDRFIIPKGTQYNEESLSNASLYNILANVYKELKDSPYIEHINLRTLDMTEFVHKNTTLLDDTVNSMTINVVFKTTDENQEAYKDALLKHETYHWEFSNEIKPGYNWVIIDSDKGNIYSDQIYESTQTDLVTKTIVQHIVKDSWVYSKKQQCFSIDKNIVRTSAINLLIKEAIVNRDISKIYDNHGKWTFWLAQERTISENSKTQKTFYSSLTLEDNTIVDMSLNMEYLDYDVFGGNGTHQNEMFAITDEDNNLLQIFDTDFQILPDLDKVQNEIFTLVSNNSVETTFSEIRQCIDMQIDTSTDKKEIQELEKFLQTHPEIDIDNHDEVTIEDFGKSLSQGNIRKYIQAALQNIPEIEGKIFSTWKSKETIKDFYPAFTNILYNDEFYCVGNKQSPDNLPKGIRLRQYTYQGDNFIEKLLPMMDVLFVRNNQLTVYPFPFKIIKEALLIRH